MHCKISQNLTVNFNRRFFQTVNEFAVRQTIYTRASVNTCNTSLTELTLTLTTVTVCILTCFNNCLFSNTENTATSTVITFSLLQNFFVTTTSDNTTFYTSHNLSPD